MIFAFPAISKFDKQKSQVFISELILILPPYTLITFLIKFKVAQHLATQTHQEKYEILCKN